MCPMTDAERHDAPGLIDELVPSIGAVIDDIRIGTEDAVGQPIVAHELPDVLEGFSSGHFGGSGRSVMLGGTSSRSDMCQPAWSISITACAPGATAMATSARCRFIAAILQRGRMRAAPLPSFGQIAPKM